MKGNVKSKSKSSRPNDVSSIVSQSLVPSPLSIVKDKLPSVVASTVAPSISSQVSRSSPPKRIKLDVEKKKLLDSVDSPVPPKGFGIRPITLGRNIPVVLSNNQGAPRHVEQIVSHSSSIDDVSNANLLFKHGDAALPVSENRIKIVNPNGYSLNYLPNVQQKENNPGKYQLLLDLNAKVDNLCSSNINSVDRLIPLATSRLDTVDSLSLDEWGPPKVPPKRWLGLDDIFRVKFPDRNSLLNICVSELPSVPVCPDVYARSTEVLERPKLSQTLLELFPKEAHIYSIVRNFNKPNYRGARLPISKFPIDTWKEKLSNYEDQQLLDFLEFGWPVGYESHNLPTLDLNNHPSFTYLRV